MEKRRDTNEFTETVKGLRARMGLSQEKFAAEVGVTASTINRWENGRGKPSPPGRQADRNLEGEFGGMKIIQTERDEATPINYALFENNLTSDPSDCAAQAPPTGS